jgi:hypothetical protein
MTYDQDPARWSTDPDEAPELLRGAFSAGRKEGPDRTHMRALAVKLAAASAGGAVAVGTVKAASAGNTIATAATWSAGKIAGVIALAGSVVTGAVVFRGSSSDVDAARSARAPIHATAASAPATVAGSVEQAPAAANAQDVAGSTLARAGAPSQATAASANVPSVQSLNGKASAGQPTRAVVAHAGTRGGVAERSPETTAAEGASSGAKSARSAETRRSSTGKNAERRSESRASETRATQASSSTPSSGSTARAASTSEIAAPTEVSLLRSAQVALQARPREAFQLTQQHRKLYPNGVFAQERDALAIQALMRSGDTEQARSLAQSFIRSYPSSPHAHRFREAMGIR